MNIVVALKQVPDLQQIRIRNRQPVLDDVPLTLGNIDKNALEAAVAIKEAQGGNVIALSAGDENIEDTIKEALAAGADEAFLVVDDQLQGAESSLAAMVLAEAVKKLEDVGLILFGEGSADNYSGQVGSRVAEILGLPQVAYASSIEVNGSAAQVIRSLEDCDEVVEVTLPAVITVLADINEARIPSVTQILKAGKKPKEVVELNELDTELPDSSPVETLSNLAPDSQRKKVIVKSADELIQSLAAEGVIRR